MKRRYTPKLRRRGLTLLEVILATAIFLGALTAILQLMSLGHDSRISAKLDAEAALRCETRMGRLVAGMDELTADSQPFEDNENWIWTTEVNDGGATDLLLVSVRVEHAATEQLPNSSFTLVRLMRDPQLFLDAALAASASEEEDE